MSDFRFNRLERHRVGGSRNKMRLSIPAPLTSSGKWYQYSPNPAAAPRLFLLGKAPVDRTVPEEHRSRIRREPGPGKTVCPYSGFMAPDEDFVHFDDIAAVKKQVVWAAGQDVGDYFDQLTRDFNRRQPRNSLISVRLRLKRSHRPKPMTFREDLLRNLQCEICLRAYGVYAIALFCPDCGGPNLALHFRQEVELVRQQISLADQQDQAGSRELAYRLMGNAHEDVLTAFETALKTVYRYLVRQHRAGDAEELLSKKLVFQNIERSRDHFAIFAIDPFAVLPVSDLEILALNIQKRHVIGHNLGIADEHYSQLTQIEQPGETVRLMGDEINRFARLCLDVVAGLEGQLLPITRLPQK